MYDQSTHWSIERSRGRQEFCIWKKALSRNFLVDPSLENVKKSFPFSIVELTRLKVTTITLPAALNATAIGKTTPSNPGSKIRSKNKAAISSRPSFMLLAE
jgi:hypothetical protein